MVKETPYKSGQLIRCFINRKTFMEEEFLMLVAVFLFLLNGVMPMWVRDHLGPEACLAYIILATYICIMGCALAFIKLGDVINRRVEDKEKAIVQLEKRENDFSRIIKRINPNYEDPNQKKIEKMKKKMCQAKNRDTSSEKILVYIHMFIGIISAIIFMVAVPGGDITLIEFFKYAAIPAVFLDIIYFFDSMDICSDFITAVLSTLNRNILGWGLSLFSFALMAITYVMVWVGIAVGIIIFCVGFYIIMLIIGLFLWILLL